MPSLRALCVRLLLRHSVGRLYRRAGESVTGLRELDDLLIRTQRLPRGSRVTPVTVNGLAGEWVFAPGADSDAAILHLHGGAFVSGSPAAFRELAARISDAAGIGVLSSAYRLAPEHPFPAAVDDAVCAYQWLLDLGYSSSSLVLGGVSSGGGLALQAMLKMKEAKIPLPAVAFFLSPVTDWVNLDGGTYATHYNLDPLLSPSQCRYTASLYVGDEPRDNPLFRPTEMDINGLPPLWIHAGDHEILVGDAERLARRAARAGVDVEFEVWPGLWHAFQTAARLVPEARQSLSKLGTFVRQHVGR